MVSIQLKITQILIMIQKHFQIIAGIIASMPAFSPNLRAQKRSCALAFARELGKQNPKFKEHLFLKACGVED